jgi:hypothetical protein
VSITLTVEPTSTQHSSHAKAVCICIDELELEHAFHGAEVVRVDMHADGVTRRERAVALRAIRIAHLCTAFVNLTRGEQKSTFCFVSLYVDKVGCNVFARPKRCRRKLD